MNPIVSVIVPVFNSAKYIPTCVDSILSQSYTDFELLLVDDGSTDDSGSICESYSNKDSRVRVIHKKNGGVCSARNRGLDNAKGDYIVFVDSDDYVNNHYLEHLMSVDADFVLAGIQRFGSISDKSKPNGVSYFGIEDLPLFWNTSPIPNYLYIYSTTKRFNASIIRDNSIRFNESLFFSEDMFFNMIYMSFANSFCEIPYSDYMYRTDYVSRHVRYKMSVDQLTCHYEYMETCFLQLYSRLKGDSLSLVRDDTAHRLMGKFVSFLLYCDRYNTFSENICSFQRKPWHNYMIGLLKGKKEKRVVKEAIRFPLLTYLIENRLFRYVYHRKR